MKLHGMKKVCQESRYAGQYPIYLWVNRRTGEVFGNIDSVRPSEDWADKDIRLVCSSKHYLTMAEIREEAERAIRESYEEDKRVEMYKERLARESAQAEVEHEQGYQRWLAKQARA